MNDLNKKLTQIGLLSLVILFLFSCSNTKYIQNGEYLYTGAQIKIVDDSLSSSKKKAMSEELHELLRPLPNSGFLGFRPKLFFYNLAGNPQKNSKIRNWFRNKLGQAPVLYNQVDLQHNSAILSNRLENQGYFNVVVNSDTVKQGPKKRAALYTIEPKDQYLINQVTFVNDSTALQQLIYSARRFTKLKKGTPYNLENIKEERVRFDNFVKNKGYYYFSANDIIVQVDSSVGNHQVDLFVKVKNSTPKAALSAYSIDSIYVYSDYVLSDTDIEKEKDSAYLYKDLRIIDPNKTFKPGIFDRAIFLNSGDLYNRNKHNMSLNRLVNLGVFKFVKNSFEISDTINNKLNVYYFLTPDNPKAIRFELLGKNNSASYTGAELNLNWSNKNFFKGAEVFSVSAYAGADFQMSAANKGYDVYKAGLEATLTWPRLISPFEFNNEITYTPKTRATIGYEYLERSKLYALNSFKASWGYLWRKNAYVEHQLNPLEVTYVAPQHVTDMYYEYAQGNPSLQRVLDKQLIFGPTYSFTYTNTMKTFKEHTYYYRGIVDMSGNITGLLMGADYRKDRQKSILGVPFSQYVKIDQDVRHYWRLGRYSQLVSRARVGVGIAYGNSKGMPYTKQFFIGGTNSIRAFKARSLGPGSFNPHSLDTGFIPDQSGDMILEFNIEYRKKLFSIVHGALFVDMGNIWNLDDVSDRPGGKFTSDFYKEIAIGTGAGLRFDITFLVLRLDLAFPLRIPYNKPGDRWVIDDIRFGDSKWRKDNLMFNLAIGYPF
ncbi:translocation and assembly module lipoprotein TamL [Myroides sp. LJL119]